MDRINNNNDLIEDKNNLLDHILGYSQLEMYKEALELSEQLINMDSQNPLSYRELGVSYEEKGEIDKAKTCYCKGLKLFPDYGPLYTNLGYIYEIHEKLPGIAIVCYEKALELNPKDKWAFNNIGHILQSQGKWKQSLVYYAKAYEASKSEGREEYKILHNLAWAYYRCKDYKKAWNIYEYLFKKYENISSVYSDFCCVNYKMGLYDNALYLVEKAVSMESNNRYYKRLYKTVRHRIDNLS